jgi:hypothetical protein
VRLRHRNKFWRRCRGSDFSWFLCCDCYLFCFLKKRNKFFSCSGTVQYGIVTIQNQIFGGIRSRPFISWRERPLALPYRGQIPLFSRVFRQFLFSSVGFSFNLHYFQSLVWLVSFEFSWQFMPVTRSTNQRRVQVDHEIQNTLRRLRKEARVNTMVVAR